MTNLVILSVSGAPKSLTGKIQRIMLEIRPGTFVWKLSSRKTKEIWGEVVNEKDCNAVCVYAAKNEAGFVVATHGKNRREVISNNGIPLVSYKKCKS